MKTNATLAAGLAALGWLVLPTVVGAGSGPGGGGVMLVPTFHCIGVYWSPDGGGADRDVLVKYRPAGRKEWRMGLPLRHHPVDTPECKADYRGSLVNLTPGTSYDIVLDSGGDRAAGRVPGHHVERGLPGRVRGEGPGSRHHPEDRSSPASRVRTCSTTARGARLTPATGTTSGSPYDASYVILRGFTIRNVKEHGIRLFGGHHIVIEDCDISQLGQREREGLGQELPGLRLQQQQGPSRGRHPALPDAPPLVGQQQLGREARRIHPSAGGRRRWSSGSRRATT